MSGDAIVFLSRVGSPIPRNFTDTSHTEKKEKKKKELHQSCFLPATFLSGVELVSETKLMCDASSDSSVVSRHALALHTPTLCPFLFHCLFCYLFFLFVFFPNKLGRGTSTLALYIAWYSDESAENIGTDLLKCFLCTSLSCSISSPHYDI